MLGDSFRPSWPAVFALFVGILSGAQVKTTAGNGVSSTLVSYPLSFVHVGLGKGNELDLLPPTYAVRDGVVPNMFAHISGTEDAGVGFKHLVLAKARTQGAISAFFTFPSGTPGPNGLSAGLTTVTLAAAYAYKLSPALTTTLADGLSDSAAPDPAGIARHFVQNTPSITFGLTVARRTTLIAQSAAAAPSGPGAGTGLRSLIAIQRIVVPRRVFIDVDYEANLLPRPGMRSHAIDVGAPLSSVRNPDGNCSGSPSQNIPGLRPSRGQRGHCFKQHVGL